MANAVILTSATTSAGLPASLLLMLILLNSNLGLVAGEWYFRDGLVAAISVHF